MKLFGGLRSEDAGPLLLANAVNDVIAEGEPTLDYLVGFALQQDQCVEPGVPIAYLHIGSSIDWIKEVIEYSKQVESMDETIFL